MVSANTKRARSLQLVNETQELGIIVCVQALAKLPPPSYLALRSSKTTR